MTVTGGFPVVRGSDRERWRVLLPPVEKSRSNKGLHNDATPEDRTRGNGPGELRQTHTSRFDTRDASSRHTTRHSAPFVAQVLGQAMAGGEVNNGSARSAYAQVSAVAPFGQRLDRCA